MGSNLFECLAVMRCPLAARQCAARVLVVWHTHVDRKGHLAFQCREYILQVVCSCQQSLQRHDSEQHGSADVVEVRVHGVGACSTECCLVSRSWHGGIVV